MFVLSAAMERTGVIASASRLLQAIPIRNERFALLLLLPPVVAISAFVNNTPVVVVFLPIIVTLARRHKLAASHNASSSSVSPSPANAIHTSAWHELGTTRRRASAKSECSPFANAER
jgi:Na+/H+ antiporter NhaD/arsenite permease-like protein